MSQLRRTELPEDARFHVLFLDHPLYLTAKDRVNPHLLLYLALLEHIHLTSRPGEPDALSYYYRWERNLNLALGGYIADQVEEIVARYQKKTTTP